MNQERFKVGEKVFTKSGVSGRVKDVHQSAFGGDTIYEVSIESGAGIMYIRESDLAALAEIKHGWVKYEA